MTIYFQYLFTLNRYTQMGVRKAIGTKYNRERAQNPVKNSARLPWAAREKGFY